MTSKIVALYEGETCELKLMYFTKKRIQQIVQCAHAGIEPMMRTKGVTIRCTVILRLLRDNLKKLNNSNVYN